MWRRLAIRDVVRVIMLARRIQLRRRGTILGRYYSDKDHWQFLEFRADGTVFMSVGGGTASYAVDKATVVISTRLLGAAHGSIPWLGSDGIGTNCAYTGVMYQRIFFDAGGSTIQQALAGGWHKPPSR